MTYYFLFYILHSLNSNHPTTSAPSPSPVSIVLWLNKKRAEHQHCSHRPPIFGISSWPKRIHLRECGWGAGDGVGDDGVDEIRRFMYGRNIFARKYTHCNTFIPFVRSLCLSRRHLNAYGIRMCSAAGQQPKQDESLGDVKEKHSDRTFVQYM